MRKEIKFAGREGTTGGFMDSVRFSVGLDTVKDIEKLRAVIMAMETEVTDYGARTDVIDPLVMLAEELVDRIRERL